MCTKYLGFVLLIWFPAVLHAQSAAQSCSAPRLDGGFFAPNQETYPHGTTLTYLCDKGRKPAVKGWSATSTCQNGNWSDELQCIDEAACTPPTIPNATYTENQIGWYENGHVIRIKCDEGYQHKDHNATARCENGEWSPLPICEISTRACGAPPKIPHASVVGQGYKEVFAADSEVQYECENGYTAEEADKTSIICISGTWTEGPVCISDCGRPPVVPNGVVIEHFERYSRYACNNFYKLVGPETVKCDSNGTWSEVPTCNATYCSVDTNTHPELKPTGTKFLKDGETVLFDCVKETWYTDYYAKAECRDGRLQISRCCTQIMIKMGFC